MTRKTGKTAVKARQQMRAAKLAKYKRELEEAGVKLSLPKPSAEARKQKEEELKRLYAELFPKKAEAEGEREEQAEQPAEQEQQPEEKAEEQPKEEEQPAEGEQQPQPEQEQPEQQPAPEQKEQPEPQEQADEPQEKQGEQSD